MSLLRHIGTKSACTHAYIPVHTASGRRDAAEWIPGDRLPVFQRKDTDRIRGRVNAVFD